MLLAVPERASYLDMLVTCRRGHRLVESAEIDHALGLELSALWVIFPPVDEHLQDLPGRWSADTTVHVVHGAAGLPGHRASTVVVEVHTPDECDQILSSFDDGYFLMVRAGQELRDEVVLRLPKLAVTLMVTHG